VCVQYLRGCNNDRPWDSTQIISPTDKPAAAAPPPPPPPTPTPSPGRVFFVLQETTHMLENGVDYEREWMVLSVGRDFNTFILCDYDHVDFSAPSLWSAQLAGFPPDLGPLNRLRPPLHVRGLR